MIPQQQPSDDLLSLLQELKSASTLQEVAQGVSRLERWPTPLKSFPTQLKQIREARTLPRAVYYVERLIKALTKVKTSKLNDINLNAWQDYDEIHTDSLWIIPKRDRTGVHCADYWGNFVPQIPHQMMLRYTKQGEVVLDTFSGSGTTMIECQRLGRNGLGIELQPSVAERSRELLRLEPNPHNVTCRVEVGDSSQTDFRQYAESVQLAVLHPPYHDIIRFSEDPACLSNAATVEGFLTGLRNVVKNVSQVLDRKRFLVLVIGDKYTGSEWIPLGFQSMQEVQNLGYSLKSIIVKNFDTTAGKRAQGELWRYRALCGGFYLFKHEYVFVFQKL